MAENKKVTFFTDEKGLPSSTRLTGFITSISLIAVVIMNIIYRSDWKLALVSDAVLTGVTIGCYYLRKFSCITTRNFWRVVNPKRVITITKEE